MARYSLLISFTKKDQSTVEVRRVSVSASSEAQAMDIATGVAIVLSRHGHLGMVDSVTETDANYGEISLEQAIIWAVTVGMPDVEPEEPEKCGRILFISRYTESPTCQNEVPCKDHG